ncbi:MULTISPECIES: flavin-dependent oxidoreductase [unclassified Beijerinckia]|uniref:flavin-dependent oxidoreductase n=1 Tax=unclassified Beijerinckia TaxID=2638183 RepID=UPI00089B3D59|nr:MULTISPECIES: flavin-dependent oxidoreductase [unclassified Beijerinckia]MDH7797341.1 2-polyprenyl-6-methoxyphenol hydroxylase-like FAD-dependent oxidoreductase [Beijerinckia sp. GAS462]SEC81720.1 2-polyprenyl-6-methoxyphenol hydroxylase [Beijerinckia sp. 28-YEA-48]
MHIAIAGGGIAGLCLALNLKNRGIDCTVYERVPDVKELGVGITLLPHAMREFAALGVADELQSQGITNIDSCFFNRFGQLIYKEPRGKFAGYPQPEVGIHRGKLHLTLFKAAKERLGADKVITDWSCAGFEQDDKGVTVHFKTFAGEDRPSVHADALIACDGINSAIRKQLYPDDKIAFGGINTWRGVTKRKPILSGRSYMRVGSIKTGKMVIYPIIDNVDGEGNQLINWMAEIEQPEVGKKNDWNQSGKLEDFKHIYKDWRFDWLDVADMIEKSEMILEYPMVDKDPVDRWTFGRVTLMGDAAHPMYPRGSNGSAQAAIDARTLADCLQRESDAAAALAAYDAARVAVANKVVLTNRSNPPDFINIKVEELVGDKPFDNLDRYITQDELRALSDNYKKIAGFAAPLPS